MAILSTELLDRRRVRHVPSQRIRPRARRPPTTENKTHQHRTHAGRGQPDSPPDPPMMPVRVPLLSPLEVLAANEALGSAEDELGGTVTTKVEELVVGSGVGVVDDVSVLEDEVEVVVGVVEVDDVDVVEGVVEVLEDEEVEEVVGVEVVLSSVVVGSAELTKGNVKLENVGKIGVVEKNGGMVDVGLGMVKEN